MREIYLNRQGAKSAKENKFLSILSRRAYLTMKDMKIMK